jgi:hypothetical protein
LLKVKRAKSLKVGKPKNLKEKNENLHYVQDDRMGRMSLGEPRGQPSVSSLGGPSGKPGRPRNDNQM